MKGILPCDGNYVLFKNKSHGPLVLHLRMAIFLRKGPKGPSWRWKCNLSG